MLRLFLGNQILVLLLIPVLITLYIFFNTTTAYFEYGTTFNLGLYGVFQVESIASQLLWWSGAIVCFNALMLNYLFNSNGFYEKNSYILSLLYVVLFSFFSSFYLMDGVGIAQGMLLLSLLQIFKLEYSQDGRKRTFNAGFFAGMAVTFHPPLVLLLPFLWLMITRIRPFVLREMILLTLGLLIPLLYLGAYYYIKDVEMYLEFLEFPALEGSKGYAYLITLSIFLLLLLVGWFGIHERISKSSIRFRKNTQLISLLLVFSIGIGITHWIFFQQFDWFAYVVIPMALFLPFSYLGGRQKFVPYLLFYLTISFSVIKFFL